MAIQPGCVHQLISGLIMIFHLWVVGWAMPAYTSVRNIDPGAQPVLPIRWGKLLRVPFSHRVSSKFPPIYHVFWLISPKLLPNLVCPRGHYRVSSKFPPDLPCFLADFSKVASWSVRGAFCPPPFWLRPCIDHTEGLVPELFMSK